MPYIEVSLTWFFRQLRSGIRMCRWRTSLAVSFVFYVAGFNSLVPVGDKLKTLYGEVILNYLHTHIYARTFMQHTRIVL